MLRHKFSVKYIKRPWKPYLLIADREKLTDSKIKYYTRGYKKIVSGDSTTVRPKNDLQPPKKQFLHVLFFYNIDSLSLCYNENQEHVGSVDFWPWQTYCY